jgi:hypothetical protein
MAREQTSTEFWARVKKRALEVAGVAAPLLLITLGVLHTVWRDRFTLDWPTVTLLITGVVLLFIPLRELATKLLKLKVGGFELELRKETEILSEKVAAAETDTGVMVQAALVMVDSPGLNSPEDLGEEGGEAEADKGEIHAGDSTDRPRPDPWKRKPRHYRVDFDALTSLRYEMDQLSAISPKAALVTLASTLEQKVIKLATPLKPEGRLRVQSFSMALDLLLRNKKIPDSLAEALSGFWKIRNKIVHQSAPVDDEVVKTAIDDGFRLFVMVEGLEQSG